MKLAKHIAFQKNLNTHTSLMKLKRLILYYTQHEKRLIKKWCFLFTLITFDIVKFLKVKIRTYYGLGTGICYNFVIYAGNNHCCRTHQSQV